MRPRRKHLRRFLHHPQNGAGQSKARLRDRRSRAKKACRHRNQLAVVTRSHRLSHPIHHSSSLNHHYSTSKDMGITRAPHRNGNSNNHHHYLPSIHHGRGATT